MELVTEALRITIPARSVLRQQWRVHVDGGLAVVLVGRGLGIGGPEEALLGTLEEAFLSATGSELDTTPPLGTYESMNAPVGMKSLYFAQLCARLGPGAVLAVAQ